MCAFADERSWYSSANTVEQVKRRAEVLSAIVLALIEFKCFFYKEWDETDRNT